MISLGVLASAHVPATAGGFSPLDLPGLIAWWDASDASTVTETSGAVSAWNDKSGNGWHLLQATSGNQPTLGSIGSLDAINVGNGRYLATGATPVNRAAAMAFGAAARFTTFQTNEPLLSTNPAGPRPVYASATNFRAYGGAGGAIDGPTRDTNGHRFITNFNGSSSSFTVDGTAYTGTLAQQSSVGTDVIVGSLTTSFWGTGTFGELVVCSPLSAGDVSALDAYLSNKWGI